MALKSVTLSQLGTILTSGAGLTLGVRSGCPNLETKKKKEKKTVGPGEVGINKKKNRLTMMLPSFFHSRDHEVRNAAATNQLDVFRGLLRDNPTFDINKGGWANETLLTIACENNQVEVVRLLLAHPDIDVNQPDICEFTPFAIACEHGYVPIIRLLLKDPRVDVTRADQDYRSAIWKAVRNQDCRLLTEFIASGRDFGDLDEMGFTGKDDPRYCSLWHFASDGIAEMLSDYTSHHITARIDACEQLGYLGELAAEFFALTVFLCDGLLQLKADVNHTGDTNATRFFTIARNLPMELQMVLSYRVISSGKNNILSKDSEAAFKYLAMRLLLPSQSV